MSDARCIFLVIKGFFLDYCQKQINTMYPMSLYILSTISRVTSPLKKNHIHITAWFSKKSVFSRNFAGFREPLNWKKIMKQLKEWNSKKKREGEDLLEAWKIEVCGDRFVRFTAPPPITYFVNFTLSQQQQIIFPSYLLPHFHILYSSFIHIALNRTLLCGGKISLSLSRGDFRSVGARDWPRHCL